MLCQNCKAEVSDALILCPQCGHDLTAPPDPVVSEAADVAPPPPQQARPAARPVPVRSVEAPARRGSGFSGWVWVLALGLLISCVVVAFVAAGLGGMYQGLKERDRLNQVLAGEHYNRGLEHFQANEPELAMAEFEEALRINPGYLEAYDKLKELRAKSRVQPTPTSALVRQAVGDILAEAQAQYDAGEWTSAINRLEQLKSLDAGFQADNVREMLYDAYLNNANALLQNESPEEALRSFDAALAIKSDDTEIQAQQDLIKQYLSALGYAGSNPEQAAQAFSELYQEHADFLDVKNRTYQAHADYAGLLAEGESWCDAAEEYASALEVRADDDLKAAAEEVQQKCETNPTSEKPQVALTPGETITATVRPTRTRAAAATRPAGAAGPRATQPVSPNQETAATPSAAPAPTLSGVLAYSAIDPDRRHRVYVIRLDEAGSAPNVLVQDAMQPAFSQDGKRLAYRSLQSDIGGIRVADLGGENGMNVTKFIEDGFPSWGPDGTQVVIASTRESDRRPRIFTTWAGGLSDGSQLTLGSFPAWSSQGVIAYHGCDPSGGNCGIWRMNPDGGGPAQATNHESDTAPAWSPDGGRLAFMSARDGNWEVYAANADGSGATRLTSSGTNDGLPVWSPDGKSIAFVSDRGGEWALYVVPSGGGDATKLVATPNLAADWQEQRLAWRN